MTTGNPPGAAPSRPASPLLRWLTLSGVDAVGRVLLQVFATVLFARLLEPEVFGLAALMAVYVNSLSTVVSALFEEALAQRLRVRKHHFSAALTLTLLCAAVLYAGVVLLAALFPKDEGTAAAAMSLAVYYALILFSDGPLSVFTAIARRQRRFADIALGNLLGLSVGTALGLALAFAGVGAWSLLAVPFTARFVNLVTVIWRSPVSVRPTLRIAPGFDLLGFGGMTVITRLVSSLRDIVFQTFVTRYFGLEGNGFFNMAMRIVEPIRGVTGSIGHNIAIAYYSRLQADPDKLRNAVRQTIADTALLLQPVFIGLALTAPTILLVIAGPQWSPSAPVAILLALFAAVGSATAFLHNGLLASGRADIGLGFSVLELVSTAACLVLFAPLGLVAIGLGRLLPALLDAAAVLAASRRIYGITMRAVLKPLISVSLCTGLMSIAVLGLQQVTHTLAPALRLVLEILCGVLVYVLLIWILHGASLRSMLGRLLQRSPLTPTQP